MDYISTTKNRALDQELQRMYDRISALEGGTNNNATTTPVAPTAPVTTNTGVNSLTLTSSAPMQGDLIATLSGQLAALQTAPSAFTLSVPNILTTKGDLLGFSTVLGRLPVGSNTQVLTADSTQTFGLKWATPASASPGATNILYISSDAATVPYVTPNATTELYGTLINRSKFDLTNFTSVRLIIANPNVSPLVKPNVSAQYSSTGGASWAAMDGGSGPTLIFDANLIDSGFVTLVAGAKADVLLRIITDSGNGVATHNYGSIMLQAK